VTLKKLGRYEVLRVLGKGAMGVVYEGRDPNLDRRVAIKTVKVENLSEEAAAEYEHRFRTEARSAARLQHPNIVSVYDSDRDGDVAFLIMEYIQGDDLKHHLDRGVRYTLEQSLKIIRDLLSALDYAHKQGIVHRDIKPANLLIEPGGRVKLTDFGVARIQDSGEATRTQGSMVGTLKYMAPEQVQGQKIDSRADLFSVGVVLYQLLTDKRPFDGDNDFSIIHQIIGHHPPPPSSVNARLPGALDAVVARALAKTREERFATARDFAVALQAAIRRAEDQTVVPPMNPNKKVEGAGSRPLTGPGSVPGNATTPSTGTLSSVTQELELVYWKDVKDSNDAEDLQGFLEKFPAGIYADLARRRLRKLAGGGEPTVLSGSQPGGTRGESVFAATQFPPTVQPDEEATLLRTDTSRPAVSTDGSSKLQPGKWVQEEYTRTQGQFAGTLPGGPGTKSARADAFAATQPIAPIGAAAVPAAAEAIPSSVPATAPVAAVPASARRHDDDDDNSLPPPPARRKVPVAVLAGVGVLVMASALAFMMGRDKQPDDLAQASPVVGGAPAVSSAMPVRPVAPGHAPMDVPAAAPQAAAPQPVPPPPAPGAVAAAQQGKPGTTKKGTEIQVQARPVTTPTAAEPARVAAAPARTDTEPPAPRQATAPVAANGGNYQAVDQCRERLFLAKELCLAEQCEKSGTRNHPLCVKRRDEARLREESKQILR
jgi:serine/threonine protein kinase